jgi:16S rRNA (guanine527-N7)-methyltransferase
MSERSAELAADRERALALTPVSRETAARLDRFVDVLLTWQEHTNLIAASTEPMLWTRHIADSLQLLPLAPSAKVWADLGSGAGFPGLVIACALADEQGAQVHLVESNHKKSNFLREAIAATQVPAIVHTVRIEDFVENNPPKLDVVAARALAPLPALLPMVYPLLKRGALGLFPKGQDVGAELTESSKYWKIQSSLVQSRTNPTGQIVVVRDLEPLRPPAKAKGKSKRQSKGQRSR